MAHAKSFPKTQQLLSSILLFGDTVACLLGLALAYFLRFRTPLNRLGVESAGITLTSYLPLIALGTCFFIFSFAYLNLYDVRLLLRAQRAFVLIARAMLFWLIAFLTTSLVFKFDPAVSRIFALIALGSTFLVVVGWRMTFIRWLDGSHLREQLMQKVAILGWTPEAEELANAIDRDDRQPYSFEGVVDSTHVTHELGRRKRLGAMGDLESIIRFNKINILIVADLDLTRDEMLQVASICERTYTRFMIIPSFFQLFVTNLRMQTVSGVPVLGHEPLPVTTIVNQMAKRTVDVIGALVGLSFSLPVMAILTIIIKRESPGPVIYKQTRTGLHGQPFTIYKMRSMRLDAEKGGAQWAVAGDPRRLKIGTFMRATNLDELPQFWNVLIGDMSLVGPRPERPELIAKFEREIPHYNPRHEVRPGVTGWAQVNGLRGNTSLVERIRYDLYYIENWSIWFDIQIMLMTFLKQKNAY